MADGLRVDAIDTVRGRPIQVNVRHDDGYVVVTYGAAPGFKLRAGDQVQEFKDVLDVADEAAQEPGESS